MAEGGPLKAAVDEEDSKESTAAMTGLIMKDAKQLLLILMKKMHVEAGD